VRGSRQLVGDLSATSRTCRERVGNKLTTSRRGSYVMETDMQSRWNVALTSLTERDNRLAHYFALVWGLGYVWTIYLLPVKNLASYSCSATPISHKGNEISRVSRVISEIGRGTDRRTTDAATEKALTL